MTELGQTGALVIGGEHPGLGVARSLGRRGVPVYIIDDQHCISSFSRYATRVIRVPDLRDEARAVSAVLDVGLRFNLRDWVLFPTRDETVAAFSRHRDELQRFFRVTTPPWEAIKWAWNKKNTYDLANELGIPCPQTFSPRSADELPGLYSRLPLAIKPAVKENFFYATGDKAWRADTPDQLQRLYTKAAQQINPEHILVQEIIPGDGRHQLSYCAFVRDGEVHSSLTARRARQHPYEFGRAATYVETVEAPFIEELAKRFLKAIDFYGLVEIEFKKDSRDGKFKLLDVNARTWGFHTLGQVAGVDFPYLLFADQLGRPVSRVDSHAGIGWLRALTDLPVSISDMFHRRLTWSSYVESLRNTKIESVFAKDDPLPFLAEILLLPYFVARKL